MSERQLTQTALLVANYMTRGQYDSEVGVWGYYTKSAFRKFLEEIQITDVLREHLNSSVYHYVDELPTEVANALLAKGPDEVTTDGSLQAPQEPEKDPEQNSEQESETETDENSETEDDEETEYNVEDQPEETSEETSEETEKSEDAQDAEETSEEKPKTRRSRRS